MRDVLPCKYVNSINETIEFGASSNFLNEGDIRNYYWNYTTQYEKVKAFNKQLSERTLPVYFYGESMYNTAERFYEVIDRDVMTGNFGKLYIGDYFVRGYIVQSEKSRYTNGAIVVENLTMLSDFRWWREVTKVFGASERDTDKKTIDYVRDYKMDYAPPGNNDLLRSGAVAPYEFEIVFQGPIVNPALIVGDNIYRVYTELLPAEHLTINSLEKEVYRTKVRGVKVNEFSNRDRKNYIFQKMPVTHGTSKVVWKKGTVVSVKAFVERSEPRWLDGGSQAVKTTAKARDVLEGKTFADANGTVIAGTMPYNKDISVPIDGMAAERELIPDGFAENGEAHITESVETALRSI